MAKRESLGFERLTEVSAFFNDKIVKDFVCGRGMLVVLAEEKPKEPPKEVLNF